MKEVDRLFGIMDWCGVYDDMPALIGSYSCGATLYVYHAGKWWEYAKGENVADVTPHQCKECGSQLPMMPIKKEVYRRLLNENG